MTVLDEVRTSCAAIAASSQFVRINLSRIEDYALGLPLETLRAPSLDPATHYLGEPSLTLAYILTLDAINFGSGFFPHLRKREGMSGYFTVAASLKDAWPLSVSDLAHITPAQCAELFGQTDTDDSVMELMGLFARALNDLGALVETHYAGRFEQLVAAAERSAAYLAELLTAMPFYRDVGFFKRAQLSAADLSLAGVAQFDDLDRLTMFADNLVPHVLRLDGLLTYDPELLARINREELIPAGSQEEREIRACALHAVERMRAFLPTITAMQLDYLLWNRGQHPEYKALPRHRTRTVYY